MSVDALGNYLMTEAEIAAVQEGKTCSPYFLILGLDRTEHMSFLSGQDRTPKLAGHVLPDRTKSGPRLFLSTGCLALKRPF